MTEIVMTDEEAQFVRDRVTAIPSWDGLVKSFPVLKTNIEDMPDLTNYRKVNFMHEILLDAICEAKGQPHGSLDSYI